MRRRTLLGGEGNIEYVFSAQSTSVSVSYSSGSRNIPITSTANGTNIGYSVVSYDGTVVRNVTTAATSVSFFYNANSTYSKRSGNVVLKQNDSNKTITITVSQAAQPLELGYGGILLDGSSGSYGSISFDSNGSTVGFSSVPYWVDVTYSDSKINVTALSTNSSSAARLTTVFTVIVGSQSTKLRIIQLPSDYHSRSYVSIGGKNWAIKNVGASSVQDYGNYYMYGKGSRVYNSSDSAYGGNEDPLASSADTATQVMGSGWRMPTRDELSALASNSNYWVSYNGVNGGVFNSSGEVLFFPAAGIKLSNGGASNIGDDGSYWGSTPISNSIAYFLRITNWERYVSNTYRYYGYSVRGVQS